MKPRIGLTPTPAVYDDRLVEEINRAYVDSVVRAGGLPFVLPVLEPADAELALLSLDGLLLTGGGDVAPARYGAMAVPEVYGVEPGRDAWEVALVAAAAAAGLPLLGICRGAQLLNVARGGTLVQHLPAVSDLPHRDKDRFDEPVHRVRLADGTMLATIVGSDELDVNSLHHQAVEVTGRGLRAVAWADDGVVEAVEATDGWRAMGVQWHPELLPGWAGHDELFTWLVGAASRPSGVSATVEPGRAVPAA